MKLELSDGNSDFSNDSQCSQISTTEFVTMGGGMLLTPSTFITSLEGLNSGVPTRTTPTLTPTTLRNIEQTFIELQSTKNESHENEAGFVPPLVHSIGNNQYISASDADIYSNKSQQSLWPSSLSQSSSDSNTRSTPPLVLQKTPSRRNMGGRKPAKDLSLSPEEEERRKIRRERNKQAAARCRKRRVDHTNSLIKETDDLEAKKQKLQEELYELKMLKEQLDCFIEMHKNSPDCRLHHQNHTSIENKFTNNIYADSKCDRVKTEKIELPEDDRMVDTFVLPSSARKIMLGSTVPITKPSRPNYLNVGATAPLSKNNMTEIAGIPISTPSTGMTFNFDSLMGGGTGLTPVSTPLVPSCSTQQRNIPVSMADIISPDTCGPPKLVSL